MQPKLSQYQLQKMILSPQMKLYLKILQMPLMELRQNLEEEMNQNPALEEESGPLPDYPETAQDNLDQQIYSWESAEEPSFSEAADENLVEAKELIRRKNYQDTMITQDLNLPDYIHSQLNLLELSDNERVWAEELIGSLDDNGFIKDNISDVAARLSVSEKELEPLLTKLQGLDPAGIFARSLEECLSLQLDRQKNEMSGLAKKIILENFKLLQKKSFSHLARIYQTSEEDIQKAFHLIQRLDPKPGKAFLSSRSLEVVPDVILTASKEDPKSYSVEIRGTGLPKLRVNSDYKKMIRDKSLDPKVKKYIKENLGNAVWLLEALDYRKTTLASIVKEILEHQPDFAEKGFAFLKPLRMKEIAEKLKIHESTVSRAISGKYIQTPLGTYPLRSFFSGKIQSASSEEQSQKSVMERIKNLIESEDPKKPLSDQKIVKLLEKENIKIARRTVAKYREMMKILPTNLRKQK